jgi:hypothetical protein
MAAGERRSEPPHSADWNALFDALAREQVSLGGAIGARMIAELPAYAALSAQELAAGVQVELSRVIESSRRGRVAAGERELSELVAVGEARAAQGVPVDDMLRAWRIGIQVVIARARELGAELGISDRSLLEFVESMLAWSDVAMVVTTAAHRTSELEVARQDQERRAALVRGLLLGTLGPAEISAQARSQSVDRSREYVAVRAAVGDEDEQREMARALGFGPFRGHGHGLRTLLDGDLAGFLSVAPGGVIDGVVGVGPPCPLDGLAESFRLASRALSTAQGFGLRGIHDVPGLGLRAAIIADGDVGEALSARYVDPLIGEASGYELIASLRAYFECEMHFERAATRLFVHQNTLRYRIGRFEAITGANLRDPTVAFEVWWALERHAASADRHGEAGVLEPTPSSER